MRGARRVLFLESFYGGSHREFADGLVAHSRHQITLHTLPARFWKWRMRGAALHFAREIADPQHYDVLLVSDLLSLSDLRALWGPRCPPAILYMHENQLSYPLPPGESMDLQFGFTDITSALAADRIVFNSRFHRDAFFDALPGFLRRMPEHVPRWVPDELLPKVEVLYPGCRLPEPAGTAAASQATAPLIVWNHRWEFDKRPMAFFAALRRADVAGCAFRVALLGENFQKVPKEFLAAREWLGDRLIQYGYLAERADYWQLLRQASIVVSAAAQENFGIAIVEAIWAGAYPLLPARLAYPEVVPLQFHQHCLYSDDQALATALIELLQSAPVQQPAGLAETMRQYGWQQQASSYDTVIERVAHSGARN